MLLIDLVSLLVGLKSLSKSVLHNRLGHLDDRELAGAVDVEILVLKDLLCVLTVTEGHSLNRDRFLIAHRELEGSLVSTQPHVSGRCAIGVKISLGKLQPGCHLGSLLLILGSSKGTLDRLGGRVHVRLGIRDLEGSEQCQNNQSLLHDYWCLLFVSSYS